MCVLPPELMAEVLSVDDENIITRHILKSLVLRKLRNALRRGLGANKSAKQFIQSLDQVRKLLS